MLFLFRSVLINKLARVFKSVKKSLQGCSRQIQIMLQSSHDKNPEPESTAFVSEDGGQAIFTLLTREDGPKQRPLLVHRKANGEVSMLIPVNGRHVPKELDVAKLKEASSKRDTIPWQSHYSASS